MKPVSPAFKIVAKPIDVKGIEEREQTNYRTGLVRSEGCDIEPTPVDQLVIRFHWVRMEPNHRAVMFLYLFAQSGGVTAIPIDASNDFKGDYVLQNQSVEVINDGDNFIVDKISIMASFREVEVYATAYALNHEEMAQFITP